MIIQRMARSILGLTLLFCVFSAGTAFAAAPNLLGSWKGTGKFVSADGYRSITMVINVKSQSGYLFKGNIFVKAGTDPSEQNGLTGYITGSKVYMTVYDLDTDRDTNALVDATYYPTTNTIKGYFRAKDDGVIGYFTVVKQ